MREKQTMKTNSEVIKNLCFGGEVEAKILGEITDTSSIEDLISAVREHEVCFASCSKCACDLNPYDDGYLTTHGTCQECASQDETN